jgi:hypothetical protein
MNLTNVLVAESGTDGLTDNTRRIYANLFGRLLQILHHENNHSSEGVVTVLDANARETFLEPSQLDNLLPAACQQQPRPIFDFIRICR